MRKLLTLTLTGLVLGAPIALADIEKTPLPEQKAKQMKHDTNNDGLISKSEFMNAHQKRAEEMFAKADSNNDGNISRDEKKAAHKAFRKKRKERKGDRKERRDQRATTE